MIKLGGSYTNILPSNSYKALVYSKARYKNRVIKTKTSLKPYLVAALQ